MLFWDQAWDPDCPESKSFVRSSRVAGFASFRLGIGLYLERERVARLGSMHVCLIRTEVHRTTKRTRATFFSSPKMRWGMASHGKPYRARWSEWFSLHLQPEFSDTLWVFLGLVGFLGMAKTRRHRSNHRNTVKEWSISWS